jgi:hypothetical protein
MAITIGNHSSLQHTYAVVPPGTTISHNLNDGINRMLVVMVSETLGGTTPGVSLDGVAMTKLLEVIVGARKMALFYMLDADMPDGGGNYDIVYTNGGSRANGQMFAHCFGNVKQSEPAVSNSDNSGVGQTSMPLDLNSLRNGDVIVYGASVARDPISWTPASGYTEWFDGSTSSAQGGAIASTGIRRIVTASGNYLPSATSDHNGNVFAVAIAIRPAEEVLGGPIFW